MVKSTWEIWNRLNREKNQISDFSDFYFLSYAEKNSETGISFNVVEREPVETRVLNPTASEASYKPKQRSYRKTKLIFFFFRVDFGRGDFVGGDFIRKPSEDYSYSMHTHDQPCTAYMVHQTSWDTHSAYGEIDTPLRVTMFKFTLVGQFFFFCTN